MITVLLVGIAAAVAYAVASYLAQPGRSLGSLSRELGALVGASPLDTEQKRMALLIMDQFQQAGLAWAAPAAVANAYAESLLVADAEGDGGHAWGLFQLNSAVPSAAGYGYTPEWRRDPDNNTRRIIEVAEEQGIRSQRRLTNAQLTWWFAQEVERCRDCRTSDERARDRERARRLRGLERIFPGIADRPAVGNAP